MPLTAQLRPTSSKWQRAPVVVASIATVSLAMCEPSAAATVLKFGYILSSQSQLGKAERVFADEVAKRTEGRYAIDNYPNAMLGGEVAMMKNVQLGALDLAFITGAPLPKLLPAAGVFNIPFLFHDVGAARAVLDGPIGDEYLAKFDDAGLVALAWGENGLRHLTNSKKPIRTPDDLVGLQIRLPQSDVLTAGFQAMGATVEQIPFPQVYGALQSGRVSGEENPIATILAARFYEVQKYVSLTGHVYDPAVILMSADRYAGMTDADKLAFKQASRLAAIESRAAADEAEKSGVASLKTNGMLVTDDVDKGAFVKAIASASPTFEHLFGHDAISKIKATADAVSARAAIVSDKTTR